MTKWKHDRDYFVVTTDGSHITEIKGHVTVVSRVRVERHHVRHDVKHHGRGAAGINVGLKATITGVCWSSTMTTDMHKCGRTGWHPTVASGMHERMMGRHSATGSYELSSNRSHSDLQQEDALLRVSTVPCAMDARGSFFGRT